MYGLKEKHIDAINSVFGIHPEIKEAILYGSRAKGNYRNGSDIDLSLKGELTLNQLFKIETELDDLLLPYKIDISIYHKIENPDFIEHIDRVGIIFYEKEGSKWKEAKLGNYFKVKHGYAFKGKHITKELTSNALVTLGNFHIGGGFKNSNNKYYSNDNYPSDYILKTGDIVITMTDLSKETGTLGYPAKIPFSKNKKYLHNQHVGLVEFKNENADKDFLYWIMRTREYQWYIIGSASGTSIMHTSPTRIQDYQFLLPSNKTEQSTIANILTSLDDKIDLLRRQNETLETMAKTLFRQWFIEESEEDWEEKKIGEFVKTNKKTINKDYKFSNIKYLDTGSLTDGKIEAVQELELIKAPSRAKRLVEHNDVLISTVRPNQRHFGIIKKPFKNLVVSTGFCVISCDKIDPHFIYLLLTSKEMTEYLHSIAEGSTSTYPSLKPNDIEAIEFLMPPIDKLNQFSEFSLNNWNKIDYNQSQISLLEKQRETLLPKLMSGETKVITDD